MLNKILTGLALKQDSPYAYLPDQIQDEIRAANEATSIYDIR